MRKPDRTETLPFHGREVKINIWADPDDSPQIQIEGLEKVEDPFVIYVEAELRIEGYADKSIRYIKGNSALGGVSAHPQSYFDETVEEVKQEAIEDLKNSLKDIASGKEVDEALLLQKKVRETFGWRDWKNGFPF
jgi:hypothetical protein